VRHKDAQIVFDGMPKRDVTKVMKEGAKARKYCCLGYLAARPVGLRLPLCKQIKAGVSAMPLS